MHHISYIDPFSFLSLIGLFFSYYNYKNNYSFYFINIHNNRLYFDKLFSNITTYISINVIYYFQFILEYGFVINYLHIRIPQKVVSDYSSLLKLFSFSNIFSSTVV